ncbi:metallophosphatase [Bacteroidia bacterium]|nr:metallophosphatase [Bacteroidia bacterium]
MKKLLICIVILLCCVHPNQAQATALKFNANGKFKIVQLTDIHYIYGNPEADIALECIDKTLDFEQPDLIIVTGDLIYGKPAEESMHTIIKRISSKKTPFIVLFGNHDDEFGLNRSELLKIVKSYPHNLTDTAPGIFGVSNGIVTLKDKAGKDAYILYYLDSNAYSQIEGVKGYDYIRFDQIQWYRENSAAFTRRNGGKPVPSLAFFHIPFPEFAQAAADEKAPLIGSRTEAACPPQLNSGMFTALKEMGDVTGVFVGHDHDNDYLTFWKDIVLAYGRYSGANTVYNNLKPNGCRVIELTEGEKSFKTWIRLRDGSIINMVNCPADFIKQKQ